ncbi:hypothetical protein [Marilutibacter alkalisoli]|uniref:Uncharacterized protein n=1 Tax=Marilutibacter alkalisoli TaxID=2591633 RepID=A0A514BQD5_9GAMM|nr:hypothetical protein [Lysobacter alkalisoli]QDH69613.1 hypothetical protein FKV23_05550 [Lysobacter alkalisoli]
MALSTQPVENRWDNLVEKQPRRRCHKALLMFGVFLTSLLQLSTAAVDKPADSGLNNPLIAMRNKGCREDGEEMTAGNP